MGLVDGDRPHMKSTGLMQDGTVVSVFPQERLRKFTDQTKAIGLMVAHLDFRSGVNLDCHTKPKS
jgi:hypothetical protein